MVAVGLLGRAHRHAAGPAVVGGAGPSGGGPARGPRGASCCWSLLVLLAEVRPSATSRSRLPALIWAALRFGPRGASAALCRRVGLTVWNTAHNAGPFVASRSPTACSRLSCSSRPRRSRRSSWPRSPPSAPGRRGVARQRGTAAVGRAVDGRGAHRPRRARRDHRVQRRRRADHRAGATSSAAGRPDVLARRGGRRARRAAIPASASSARTRSPTARRRPASSRACAGPTARLGCRSAPARCSTPAAGPRAW